MSKNKVRVPNIVRGGIAIPLGRNYYYMRGRKHEDGGIDIGENPRTGLEVEDGEVMHMGDKETTIYSAQKFLGGLSPAERIIRGENPERVFRAQEEYKRRNNINDDGTRKRRNGGLSRSKDYDSSKKPYPKVKGKDFAGGHRSYPIPTKADARDALRLAGLHGRNDVKAKVYRKYPELRKKARDGGVFTLDANGKSKLIMIPSTGELTLSDIISPNHIVTRYRTGTPRDATIIRTNQGDILRYSQANPLTINIPTSTNQTTSTVSAISTPKTTNNTSTKQPPFGVPTKDELMRIISREYEPIAESFDVSDTIRRANSSIIPNTTINLPSSSTMVAIRRANNETNKINRANNVADWIGLGSNITSGLIGNIINRNMLNNLEYSSAPIPRIAPKLKTRININPQLDNMRESLAAYERNVANNTGSSQVALSRQQRARLANMLGINSIYADKENTETQLINADRLNQQEVVNQNIKDYNTWAQNKAAFDNTIREQQAENNIGLIDTINSGIQNMISNRQQRRAYNQTNAAMLFASPNLPVEMLYAQGLITKETRDAYRKAYPLNS